MFPSNAFRDLKEKDIQELFFRHPYLIDESFEKIIPEQFYHLPSGFADLIIFSENTVFVVELKIGYLKKTHLLQLAQYTKEIKERFPEKGVEAILIGRNPQDDLKKLIKTYNFKVKVRILEEDIPIGIRICQECRLANSITNLICWSCGNQVESLNEI